MNGRQIECFLEAGKAYCNLFQRTYLELDRTRQALSNTTPALRLGINKDWRMPDFLPPSWRAAASSTRNSASPMSVRISAR